MAEQYHEALMRRLKMIENIPAPEIPKPASRSYQLPQVNTAVGMGSGGTDVDRFINSITKKESGGNYGAVNRQSGAMGKYQVMPSNIASWSKQTLGYSVTPQQYLANPQLQDAIAQAKLREYYSRYGAAGAAVAWYAGEGNAQKYVKNPNGGWGKPQNGYPSIAAYVQAILRG